MKELRDYRAINVRRCVTVWRRLEDWGADQWALRLVAETAELCNAVTQHMEGRKRLEDVMSEYADVYAYLDLLAARLYVSPDGAWAHVVRKFNEVSERKGFSERLVLPNMQQRDKDVALTVLKQVQLALLNADLSRMDTLSASQAVERIQALVESGEWQASKHRREQ